MTDHRMPVLLLWLGLTIMVMGGWIALERRVLDWDRITVAMLIVTALIWPLLLGGWLVGQGLTLTDRLRGRPSRLEQFISWSGSETSSPLLWSSSPELPSVSASDTERA